MTISRKDAISAAEELAKCFEKNDNLPYCPTVGWNSDQAALIRSLIALVPKELDIEKVKAFDYLIREDIFDRWIDEIPYLDDDCPEIIKAAREEK